MDNQLIFEIGTEEIPAGYLDPAITSLRNNLASALDDLGLGYDDIHAAATPRRMVVRVNGLPPRQPDRTEEIMGPPKKAAFDAEGRPTKAAEGFAKSRGVTLDDIRIVDTAKGEYLMVVKEIKGRETADVLAETLPEQVRAIPFPKSMRWGATRTTFARPIQWLTAVYNKRAVPFAIDGVGEAGAVTWGHRFMAPDPITVETYDQYVESLRGQHVLVETEERRRTLIREIHAAAAAVGGRVLEDDELVETVVNLVESPHAICGSFDEKFLQLPKDALITSMREHQKYFAVTDAHGRLMPHFVAVNNTKVKDPALGAEGHQRVLRARLEDGLFFFREDQTKSLEERVPDLGGIVFQAKLGTMKDKTRRITALAGFLAERVAPETKETVVRAALLAKADLLTEMVNEFPSLQGRMGRDYARLDGEPEEVAQAIGEHYMPVRAGGPLPASVAGAIIGIADRVDTIVGCFGIGETPTGTTDPFGLRRLALGLIHIALDKDLHFSLRDLCRAAAQQYGGSLTEGADAAVDGAIAYIKGRFVNDQAHACSPEAVDAASRTAFDDIVDCARRAEALADIGRRPEFATLAGSFKRVMNIIKGHEPADVDPGLFEEEAELRLHATLREINATATPLIDRRDYPAALLAILGIKEAVDNFFDQVMVMTDKQDVRANRLNLLAAVAAMFLRVGDVSRMTP